VTDASRGDARLPELDALRGIAALIVLLHHAQQLVPRIALPDIPGLGFAAYTLVHLTPLRVLETGRAAVLFFFVLSGYVLTRSLLRAGSPGLAAFAAQRTLRLMLPVAASVLLSAGLWWALADPALPAEWRARSLYTWLEPPDLRQVASNALLLADSEEMRLNVVLWSLVHEWRLTLLLPVVLLFRGRVALFGALLLAASSLGLMGGASENTVLLGPSLPGTLAATLYFASGIGAGVLLALRYGQDLPVLGRDARIAAVLACVALFGMASDLAAYAGSVLLILLARQPGRFRRALRGSLLASLGGLSFSLYLVHVPVLVAGLHLLHGDWPPVVIAAAGVPASLLAALAFFHAVERPAQRLARRAERRLGRPRARAPAPRQPVLRDWAPEGGMPALPR
jgi:peptidoglycan/LPS O-acetylase OafA/YrhL